MGPSGLVIGAHLLSLRIVLAQPNASVSGCEVWIRVSRSSVAFDTKRRYCSTKRADSVLPAPDSPLITIAWFFPSLMSERCVAAATAKMCGGSFSSDMLPLYLASFASVYRLMGLYGLIATSTAPFFV